MTNKAEKKENQFDISKVMGRVFFPLFLDNSLISISGRKMESRKSDRVVFDNIE